MDVLDLLDDVDERLPGDPVVGALRAEIEVLLAEVGRLREVTGSDPVTGVANRRGLKDALRREVARAAREGSPLSLVLLRVDDLDRLAMADGDEAAEQVLRAAAEAWAFQLRASDVVARVDATTFAAVLPGAGHEDATELAERLRIVMPPDASASAGVATFDGDGDGDALLTRAHAALAG